MRVCGCECEGVWMLGQELSEIVLDDVYAWVCE